MLNATTSSLDILYISMADSDATNNLFHSYHFPLRMLKIKIFGPPTSFAALGDVGQELPATGWSRQG